MQCDECISEGAARVVSELYLECLDKACLEATSRSSKQTYKIGDTAYSYCHVLGYAIQGLNLLYESSDCRHYYHDTFLIASQYHAHN